MEKIRLKFNHLKLFFSLKFGLNLFSSLAMLPQSLIKQNNNN
jgi:hypothetical protein